MIDKIREFFVLFFTNGHERTLLAKKNIAASLCIKGAMMVITFLMTPLTISYVNPVRSGIWLILSGIISWIYLFDVGFGNGLKNKFAEAKASKDFVLAKRYVSSTYAVITMIMVLIAIVFGFINKFIDWAAIFNSPQEYVDELQSTVWITFGSFSLMFVLRLITSIIAGDQKPAKSSFIDMIGQLICLIGLFILVRVNDQGTLIQLSWIMGMVPVVVYFVVSIFLFQTDYKYARPSLKYVDFSLAKKMMNLGIQFFIACVASLVMIQVINLLLTQIDPSEVTRFQSSFKVFGFVFTLLMIIAGPYWSAFTDAYALQDFVWMRNAIKKLMYVYGLCLLILIALLGFSPFIYRIWLGDLIDISFPMSVAVSIYTACLCFTNVVIYPINGIGKMRVQTISSVIEILLVIPLAFWMKSWFGAEGVILSVVIVYIPRMIWAPIQLKRLVNNKARGIWNK